MPDRYRVLATDYDGTIATRGIVNAGTLAALERARKAGLKLVLVSGRELGSLQRTFDRFELFDSMVLENGAVLYEPSIERERALCDPAPDRLVRALLERGVQPLSVGRVIVATLEPHENTVLQTIRDLGLEYQVVFNKGAVMLLPAGVTKATGLKQALLALGIDSSSTVAVGDAENDHALLDFCGVGAAVANALPALKERADIVLSREDGEGVAELIDRLLSGTLALSTKAAPSAFPTAVAPPSIDVAPDA